MGMRSSKEETEEKGGGRVVGGWERGRNPREVETVKGESVES